MLQKAKKWRLHCLLQNKARLHNTTYNRGVDIAFNVANQEVLDNLIQLNKQKNTHLVLTKLRFSQKLILQNPNKP